MRPAIIVHGGAWDIPPDMREAHLQGCSRAVEEGYALLSQGRSALDAVEAAVRLMEDDPTFDAGRGSFLNSDGEVELDAIIMEGDELRTGAVAAVQHILHPISLARAVMDRTQHCLLVGDGALRFARSIEMDTVEVPELLTCRELERWKAIRAEKAFEQRDVFEDAVTRYKRKGTVGAVALDSKGTIAAATSTGGTPNKLAGRVGDSPLIGCGNYADSRIAGVSVTGWGESIMKVVLAKRVCDNMERGMRPYEAGAEAIAYLKARVDGLAGVIVLARDGDMAHAFNTPHMAMACIDGQGRKKASL
ncbi:MAG: isoaspartyl peptidase/L-asparaginase [Methanomassiliicoccales archaeon]|jgi:beta-aspartyl-peptidase (threonine type)|nr:isoaspartyl peptidase/L-asparaginase [Methanomassiliicoccales archaeon]